MSPINPLTITVCGAISMFLVAVSLVPTRSVLAKRFEKLGQINEKSLTQHNLLVEQIVSKEYRGKLQSRLIEGGWYNVSPVTMTTRTFGALGIGVALGLAIYLLLGLSVWGALIGGLLVLICWRVPSIFLSRAIKQRKAAVSRDLPDFLDILSTTVQAGLAINAALVQSSDAAVGVLREELKSTLAEIRIGRQRSDALIAMAQRVNETSMTTMVTTIVQAERLGTSLSLVLQELAKDARDRRWLLAEEKAAKLPVTMIIPMALFMIPSLYLMIFGPVIANLAQSR